jgi:predicted CXXCH cytochrome family protein
MRNIAWFLIASTILMGMATFCDAATNGIIDTKHNLSASGPGEVHALTETRICIFCHTPHNATPSTPLWSRDLSTGVNYQTYNSTTFNVNLAQPSGPSRLCLSCHDGTIALGAVKSVSGGISMTKELTGRPSLLGTNLRDDHPFSFSYSVGLAQNSELRTVKPPDLQFYSGDVIHCTTCHDPHDDTYGMFLAVDNKNTALCVKCHDVTGWSISSHATSDNTWNGSGIDPWPINARLGVHARTTVAENGCENCHTPHNAGGPQRLMNYREEEKNCTYACHNGNVGGKNIAAQFAKISNHPLTMAAIGDVSGTPHDPNENVGYLVGHVECQDCHNPHSADKNLPATAPNVSGYLRNVKGINKLGTVVSPASYEYEICLKCHGDSNSDSSSIIRYSSQTNRRLDMATTNPSFHPVLGIGKNLNVPSLPSAVSPDQGMNASSIIYCTDCHDSDETSKLGGAGPAGPHGSIYSNLLRERYETSDGTTPESFAVYALCYRCHDRTNILSDASFQKRAASGLGGHSGHLTAGGGIPCSVCHDPHGVVDDGVSGDHTNLINFDVNVVTPLSGNSTPLFTDNGLFSGTCTLVCHGVTHDGSATYTYP